MYSYGWRDYMPDLGRWNGIDQLAESYHSISPYTYVANNPVSNTDPDGRWIYEDGSIGQAPSTWSMLGPKYKPYLSYSTSDGMGYNSSAGVSGAYSFTGNDAAAMFNYFANGGSISGITFKNGWAMWGTLEGNPFLEGYDGDMYVSNTGSVVLHRAWFGNITDLGSFWKPTSTTTFAGVTSLIMENPFIKAENTMYHTKGNAGISNIDYRRVRNINTGKQNNLVSMQLNLSYLNLYNELTTASDTNE